MKMKKVKRSKSTEQMFRIFANQKSETVRQETLVRAKQVFKAGF